MTLKQFWKNLTWANVGYTIQGYWRTYVSKKKPKLTVEDKKRLCPECWANGECINCGCPIIELFNSDKPCPNGKF